MANKGTGPGTFAVRCPGCHAVVWMPQADGQGGTCRGCGERFVARAHPVALWVAWVPRSDTFALPVTTRSSASAWATGGRP